MRFFKKVVTLVFDREAFRKERRKLGIPASALATKVGISAAHISDMELGKRGVTDEMANKLVNALKELS